jgi:putative transposase
MVLNDAGKMVKKWWQKSPKRFLKIQLDIYQIMPNHIHGIINIIGFTHGLNGSTHGSTPTGLPMKFGLPPVGADPCVRPKQTLFQIIRWFKTIATNEYIRGVKNDHWQPFNKHLFQRNYYERIIRNKNELNRIREYIRINPQIWDRDRNNPEMVDNKGGIY